MATALVKPHENKNTNVFQTGDKVRRKINRFLFCVKDAAL
jgi:hypothetical protein